MKQETKMPNGNGIELMVQQIDLSNVVRKLKLPKNKEGEGWTALRCASAALEYKRFLTLIKLYPSEIFVPNKIMDEVWHRHILDTAAYREDCSKVFGCFLDHYPYYGLNGKSDMNNLLTDFEKTKRLYKATFGEEMDRSSVATRCGKDHVCHVETSCRCRVVTACKN